jgi:UDP-2,3-diacylglucosamine pyrophosphatase LpxH
MSLGRIAILSDIHIGVDATTNWYQSKVHEGYVASVLNDVIDRAAGIRELIILGDLLDTWTYLPVLRPPTFAQVINHPANGTIMDLIRTAVDALQGRVSFVRGNHDMTLTQADLTLLQGPRTRLTPTLRPDVYLPLQATYGSNALVCTHGHRFSMLCAEDWETSNVLKPMGLGWYVTRAGALIASRLLDRNKPNVAYLPDQGAPTSLQLTAGNYAEILADLAVYSLGGAITKVVQSESRMGWTEPILRSDGSSVTLNTGFYGFANLLETWENKRYPNGERYGRTGAFYALKLPDVDNDLSWYAQLLAGHYSAAAVVMGHTHVPVLTNKVRLEPSSSGTFIYANSGFNCPSIPDMATGKHPTYVEVELTSPLTLKVYVRSSIKQGRRFTIVEEPATEIGLAEPLDESKATPKRRARSRPGTQAAKPTKRARPTKR